MTADSLQQSEEQEGTEDGVGGYIKTAAHNYVSRRASVHGARHVEMRGKTIVEPGAHIRGDLGAPVRIGRYCRIGTGAVLRPSCALTAGDGDGEVGVKYLPLVMGTGTAVGAGTVVESAAIGASCGVGSGCVLGKRSIVKDCCRIEDGTVLAPDTVIPPFSVVAGRPGQIVGELPESAAVEVAERSVEAYTEFVRGQGEKE